MLSHRQFNGTSPLRLSHQCRPQLLARLFSPYDLDPGGCDTSRGVLTEYTDFERLGRVPIKLFVTATNVRTRQGHAFRSCKIRPDVLLASACLPNMFQALRPTARKIGRRLFLLAHAEGDFLYMLRDAGVAL
jgi:predicted acylesterase/phospholipase RssA